MCIEHMMCVDGNKLGTGKKVVYSTCTCKMNLLNFHIVTSSLWLVILLSWWTG